MILVIDNFDSFTYNIVQYLQKLGREIEVKRNNNISLKQIEKLKPSHLIISPGAGDPNQAGISMEVVKHFQGIIPILGVCLGHQSIAQAMGGKIIRAKKLYHGKTSTITHDNKGVFAGLPNPLTQTRYHSLVVDKKCLPKDFIITATSEDGEIMGIRHVKYPLEGVQFHPESIASEHGYELLDNFIHPKPQFTNKTDSIQKIHSSLEKLWNKQDLGQLESEEIMACIARGGVSHVIISSLLTALSMKGESINEVAGFAKVLREKSVFINPPKDHIVIDTCGTGGDKSGTFNISTVTAIVVAGAGVYVAKHGNRSVTSKCGSADLFEQLGVKLDVPHSVMEKALEEAGLAFLFAQKLHSAMRQVIGVRKELGLRTMFNILGPLASPVRTKHQVMGVFEKKFTHTLIQVMKRLGLKRGLVVHGRDGLDEITLTGETDVCELKEGKVLSYTISPEQFGLKRCQKQDLIGGDKEVNADICKSILAGEKGSPMDIVLLNAGAALYTAERTNSIEEGIALAKTSIESGSAFSKLKSLIDITNA